MCKLLDRERNGKPLHRGSCSETLKIRKKLATQVALEANVAASKSWNVMIYPVCIIFEQCLCMIMVGDTFSYSNNKYKFK